MRNIHRFASLKGPSQQYLDWNEDPTDADPPEAPPGAGPGHSPEHDGWQPVMPRSQPLARLGDVLDRTVI